MDVGIQSLKTKNLLESNPLKSRFLARGLTCTKFARATALNERPKSKLDPSAHNTSQCTTTKTINNNKNDPEPSATVLRKQTSEPGGDPEAKINSPLRPDRLYIYIYIYICL